MEHKKRIITTDGFSRAPAYKRRSMSDYTLNRRQPVKIQVSNIKQPVRINKPNSYKQLSSPANAANQPANNFAPTKKYFNNIPKQSNNNLHKALHKVHKKINVPDLPIPKQKKLSLTGLKKNKTQYALVSLATVLLLVGVYVNISSYLTNKKLGETVVAGQYITKTEEDEESGRPGQNSAISEAQPTTNALKEYKVAPDLPKYFKIDNLGIWSRVKRVGLDEKNEIGNPKNVFDTAWYDGSAKPGEPGVVFINGHVLGPTKGGVFVNLKNIKIGTSISIIKGDNAEIKYKVVATEKFDANNVDMGKVLRPYDPNKQGLNIMTCNGKYDSKKETCNKRLVVYAVRSN